MDPYTYDLPTGEGDLNPSLFQGAPFGPDDIIEPSPDLETRQALPYTEIPDNFVDGPIEFPSIKFGQNEPVRSSFIGVAPPTPVEPPAFEDSILKSWHAEEAAALKAAEIAQIKRIEEVNGPIFKERGYDPRNTIANTVWGGLIDKQIQEKFESDYGWLGGQDFPKWEDFKKANYAENWDKLNAEQRRESFDYWSAKAADYWIGYNGVDPNQYRTAFTEASQGHLADEYKGFTVKQLQEDSEWLGTNVPSTFSLTLDEGVLDPDDDRIDPDAQGVVGKSFTAKKANLLADKANAEMRSLLESKNFISQYGGVGQDGKVSKESLEAARKSITEDYQAEISDPDATDVDKQRAEQRFNKEISSITNLLAVENPEAEITKWNEAYHRYRRMGQNLQLLQSPQLRDMLGAKTAGDFWSKVWDNKSESIGYFVGEGGAQLAESAPYAIGGAVAAAGTGPASPFIVAGSMGASGGIQEYRAIIPELIEKEFENRGLNSKDSESWARVMQDDTFYKDVLSQAARKGAVTAVVESGLNAVFSHALKLIPKKIPWGGTFLANRAGEAVAGATAAGSGEIAGQAAQRPGQPINWVDVSQELLAEGPGQMQQTALETVSSVYGKYTGKVPQPTPDDTGTQPVNQTQGTGDISIGGIEAASGAVPKSTQAPQEDGAAGTPTDGAVAPPSGQSLAETIESLTGIVRQPARSARESAGFFSSLPAAKDALESAQAILAARDTKLPPAEDAAKVISAELMDESKNGLSRLNASLRRLEFYSNLATPPQIRFNIPQTSAEKSAQAIEDQLGSEEQFRQSPEGRAALGKELQMFDTPDQPFTEAELAQLEFNGILSPEEKKQYIEFATKKAVGKSRLAFNATLAGRLMQRVVTEDRIRQSFGGMEGLRQELSKQAVQSDEKVDAAIPENAINEIVGISRQLQEAPAEAPVSTDIPTNEFSDSFRQENATLPEKAQAAWTPEVYSAVDEFFKTGNEDALAGLNKVQQNRAKAHYYGTIEERDAAAKGMSVEQAFNKKRNQGGFLDIPAIGNGVAEAAVTAWTKAKDFASWSVEMLENFGNKITPYLKDLWSRVNTLVKNVGEFFTYTENAKARQRGTIDLRQADNRPSAGGPFKYSLAPYDPETNKIGKNKIAKSGIIPESEFIAANKEPVQLKRSEFEFYKTIVPEAFKDGMVDVKKLYEGLRDNGPVVKVTKYGQRTEKSSPATFAYQDFRHTWFDNLSTDQQDEYNESVRLFREGLIISDNEFRIFLQRKNWTSADIEDAVKLRKLAKEAQDEFAKTANNPTLAATSFYDQISPFDTTSNPVIRIDLTIQQKEETSEEFGPILKDILWHQDDLHENMPNTYGWAMIQPVVNPLDGKPSWFVAELQSRWAQAQRSNPEKTQNNPLLATHQKAVINAVINEAQKEGIESIIFSDAETAMMTEQHDRNLVVPEGTHVLPSGETFVIGDDYTIYYQAGESPEQSAGKQIQSYNKEYVILKEAAAKGEVPYVVKQEKGMRVAYDVTIPSLAREVTGKVGIPVNLGEHKNKQSVYSYEGDYKGEGSIYFKNPDDSPKSEVTGKSYDITATGPRAAMLFADVFGVQLVASSVRTAFQAAKDLATFTARITKELGQWIKPYAQRLWDVMSNVPASLEAVVSEIAAEAAPKQTGRVLAKNIRALYAKEPANSPLAKALERINFQYLPYTERRDIAQLSADYFAAKKGKGPIVKTDLLQLALDNAAKLSYERAFIAAKKNFPLSLKDKKPSDFSSESDINGYVTSLHNAESDQLAARNKARASGLEKRKANRETKATATFEEAKGEAVLAISSDMVKNLSPRMQEYATKALKAILSIDPTKMTPAEKEQVTAAMQNVANGKFVGLGAILARAEAVGAMVEGSAMKKKNGSLLGIPLSGKFGRVMDAFTAGSLPQAFARHDTRERITFMTPDAKEWWSKHISKFGNEGLRIAHELQLENVRTIEGIIKKWGFSEKGLGDIAFRKTKINSAKRMGIVALLSQYRDIDNPNADLNMQMNNLIKGIQAMQADKSSVYRAIGQVEGELLKDFLIKGNQNGLITQNEEGQMEVAVSPEEWTAFLFDQLTPQEQGALQEIWAAAGKYTNDIGFVQEFVYGKEWQPWNNYVMQQAMTLNGNETVGENGMALDASTLANNEFSTPVGKTQSILNPRIGLAKGQFYNLDIFHTAVSGMNQAAYEVGTAQPRMELKALFEDPLSTDLFDSEENKKRTYDIYKDIHQKSLGIETGTSVQGSPGQQLAAYALMRPLTAWTGLIMNSIVQPLKQGMAPMIAYSIADGALGHMMEMWQTMYSSPAWTEQARKDWIKQATPALLTRIETYDPAYDDLVGSGIVEEIRRLSKDRSFVPLTAEQKRLKLAGFILNALDPIAEIPISISRKVNVTPDAFAARHIFFSEYTRYLLKKGVIKSLDEFTPSLRFDPDAATHADQIVTEALGGASSREKRPNVLSYTKSFGSAGRFPVLLVRGMLMHLAGISTQMASDTFRSLGEAFYQDPKNPKAAAQVRAEAQLRIRRNVIQNATFVAIGYAAAYHLQSALMFGISGVIGGFGDLEGLDEEEKKVLERIERARYDAQLGPVGAVRATRDIGMLFTGGMSTNNVGNLAFDKAMSAVFSLKFKEDYQKKIKDGEALLKKTTDKKQKEKIQQELDTAKAVYRNLTYQGTLGIDHGLVDGYQDIAGYFAGKVDNAEADRIAMEYYEKTKGKADAMTESPRRSGVQTVSRAALNKVLRLASTDIGTAQDRINKARKVVMEKRKRQLYKEDGTARPSPQPIDVQFGSLTQ